MVYLASHLSRKADYLDAYRSCAIYIYRRVLPRIVVDGAGESTRRACMIFVGKHTTFHDLSACVEALEMRGSLELVPSKEVLMRLGPVA